MGAPTFGKVYFAATGLFADAAGSQDRPQPAMTPEPAPASPDPLPSTTGEPRRKLVDGAPAGKRRRMVRARFGRGTFERTAGGVCPRLRRVG